MSQLSRVLSALPKAETDEYKIAFPRMGENVFRQPWKFFAADNNLTRGRGHTRLRFEIPNTNVFDFSSGYISFDVSIESNGIVEAPSVLPAYKRIRNGIWSLVQRAKHLDNMQTIQETYPYNLIYGLKWAMLQNRPYGSTVGPDLMGIGTATQRNAWGETTVRFVLPLDLGWFKAGPFPAKYMKHQQAIELTFEDPNVCIESNCGALNYTVSNAEFHCYKLLPSWPGVENQIEGIAWEERLKRTIQSGDYRVMADWWDFFQNTPIAIQGDYILPIKTACIKGIYTTFANVNDISNPQVNDTMINFPKYDLDQFFFKIFSTHFPEQAIEARGKGIEPYMLYLNWLNAWKIDGFPTGDQPTFPNAITDIPVSLQLFNTFSFVCVGDFRSTRFRDAINPILNTLGSTADVRMYLKFLSAPPVGTSTNHFTESSVIFGLTPTGETYTQLN